MLGISVATKYFFLLFASLKGNHPFLSQEEINRKKAK
jgi:hypothetical protein